MTRELRSDTPDAGRVGPRSAWIMCDGPTCSNDEKMLEGVGLVPILPPTWRFKQTMARQADGDNQLEFCSANCEFLHLAAEITPPKPPRR